MVTSVVAEPDRVDRPRSRRRVVIASLAAVVVLVGAAVFVWSYYRVRTGPGPLGSSKQIGGDQCAPVQPGMFIAAESIWLLNHTRSPAVINSITLEQPSNLTVLGFYLDDIEPRGSGELSPGNAWAPISSGVAALHAQPAIGYSVPARTVAAHHALRAAVEPVDSSQPWSYAGLVIRYRAGGHRYQLAARTGLVIPPLHHACTDALMNILR